VEVHRCQCPNCQSNRPHADKILHHRMNLLLDRLDEPQRRWFAALESQQLGHGGDRLLSLVTGLHVETIRRGRRELEADLQGCPPDRLRRRGGGRPADKKTTRT
jgi:hypothetical protein